MGNLLGKTTDPMVIIIRVVGLMAECFLFLREFIGILYFLECPPKIQGGFMWRIQMSLQLVIVRKDVVFGKAGENKIPSIWLVQFILEFPLIYNLWLSRAIWYGFCLICEKNGGIRCAQNCFLVMYVWLDLYKIILVTIKHHDLLEKKSYTIPL